MSAASAARGWWRGSVHLLVGGALAVPALLLAITTTVSVLGTLVLVGGLLLAGLLPLGRRLAAAERRRVGRWTGHPVPQLYTPATGTLVARVETMLRDPATWRDLLWTWVHGLLGLPFALLAWVPVLAPLLARSQTTTARRLLRPTRRALRRTADRAEPVVLPSSTGHGLVGMAERVAVLGGTLRTGPRTEGGFEVRAVLPLPVAHSGDETGGTLAP
ncbi:MAG TPA: sensor domain-containing protein [Actinomycetales bacterium]|nr:sensor domain-containing protein [Actinomycetales bacterium]